MTEFVGHRANMYSYKIEDVTTKKAKGMKQKVVESNITLGEYKTCLNTQQETYRSMNVIRSHLHQMCTEEHNKIALSAKDDKCFKILADRISTLAHGHYKIEK